MYPSPPSSSARKVSSTFPSASTVYAPAVSVRAARTAASRPIRRMTSLATPRASTACPPGRSSGARSTTVTSAPRRCSQWASAGPAMLAPATNTLVPLIASPAHPSGSRSGSYGGRCWSPRPRGHQRRGDGLELGDQLVELGGGEGFDPLLGLPTGVGEPAVGVDEPALAQAVHDRGQPLLRQVMDTPERLRRVDALLQCGEHVGLRAADA